MWLLPKKRGLPLCSKNSRCENNAPPSMLTLGGNFCMILPLSCLSNKSSYFSWITLHAECGISKWYSSSTRFSLHTFFVWWFHDATSTPNLCERVRRSVMALQEPRLYGGGSEMQLDKFWWFHDATSTPNFCERVRRSVMALREPRIMGVVRLYKFWHFPLYRG